MSRQPRLDIGPFDAVVALGANLGDAEMQVLRAIARLRAFARPDGLFRASSLWRTTPVDCPPGSPPFINAVVAFQPLPGLLPESLLKQLQALEREFGRLPKRRLNEPRPLDLDLIAFKDQVRHTRNLVLPHPRAQQRRFVLQPLCEICPDLQLPGWTQTAVEYLAALGSEEQSEKIETEGQA